MQPEALAEEIQLLLRCVNDLVSVLALPALWTGAEPSQVIRVLLDTLLGMLRLDFVYARLDDPGSAGAIEMVRVALSEGSTARSAEIAEKLGQWLGEDRHSWPLRVRTAMGDKEISIVPLRLGLRGDIGVLIAGSGRADFPGQTESLVLSVAANQAAIGIQEARLLVKQKRIAEELDQRVAQRTVELSTAIEELRKEVIERQRTEEELRLNEAFLAEGQRLSSTGSFSWCVDTDEITFSDELYRIFEFGRDAPVMLERIGSRVHPEDTLLFSEKFEHARTTGSDLEYEFRLRMPDDSVKYLRAFAHGIRHQAGRLEYVGAVQDVTQRRLSDEALGRVRSELARVARATTFGALTASIAHEVNQPLSGIVTNASTCLRMLAVDPPNVDGACETARRTIRDANRASDVIKRLRALFGNKAVGTERVDLNESAQEVLALTMSELQRGQMVLRLELAADLPPVIGDRVQIQQVIMNLILNATDAMSSVEDRARQLVIRTELDESARVRLSVQDVGVGFDRQSAERLFEAFYTTKSGGMGIGLSISRSIIESHRGKIWAAPNDGPGATFSFSIPCRAEDVAGRARDVGRTPSSA